MVSSGEQDDLRRLREENARLKDLLTRHGIAWEQPTAPVSIPAPTESAPAQTHFTIDDKIALFRRLFRGREDVYPQRWESAKGTSGYSPVCANEWKPGVCHKPRMKCGDCNQRQLLPVTDQVIYDHLARKQTIGVYPLLSDGSYARLMSQLAKTDLLILDDWGVQKLTAPQRNELMEVIEDRYALRSTLIASQLPVDHWHDYIGEATLADAILGRLLHNAHRLPLQGESMRKTTAKID